MRVIAPAGVVIVPGRAPVPLQPPVATPTRGPRPEPLWRPLGPPARVVAPPPTIERRREVRRPFVVVEVPRPVAPPLWQPVAVPPALRRLRLVRGAPPAPPVVTAADVTGVAYATQVGLIAVHPTVISMQPADLTQGPRADITLFTIVSLDAGSY